MCGGDGQMVQELQRGFLELTELRITALYSSEKAADQARLRLKATRRDDRITCHVGKIDALPFPEASFDLVAGVAYDDNGHAHVRASSLGPSVTIPLVDGRLTLGTWQQIVLIDFDTRPRRREVVVQVVGE